MAKQTIVTLLDDLDESLAAETVEFALDGRNYEIDLSDDNARKLREGLKIFVEAARRGGRPGQRSTVSVARPSVDREKNQKIREWAIANGYKVSDRGRLPVDVIQDYNAGTPNPSVSTQTSRKDEEPEFVDPEPVEAAKWNDMGGIQRAHVKAWARSHGIEDGSWTKSPPKRDLMAGFALNNDIKGAKKVTDTK